MKRMFLVFAAALMFLAPSLFAQDKGFGIGIILGQPTGFSVKSWTNEKNALDFGLGFSFAKDDNRIHIHADYLWHSFGAINSTERFVLYYGPGLKIKTGKHNEDAVLGIRGVFGVAWIAHNAPVDIFFELAPVMNFVPGTGFNMDAGFGARYYFE